MSAAEFFALFMVVFICAMLLFFSWPVKAHEWYPRACCSTTDCQMIPRNQVKRTPDGNAWVLPNGEIFAYDKTRRSEDQDFHWCRRVKGVANGVIEFHPRVIRPANEPACVFAPEAGG